MRLGWLLGAVAAVALPSAAHALPTTADVIVAVDESGSMSTEQAFIGPTIVAIDTALQNAGLANNQYGLVGFGGGGADNLGRDVGAVSQGGGFLSAADFDAATDDLVLSGGFEDGYSAIDFAFNSGTFTFRSGDVATNVILITDEDRDNGNAGLTFDSILSEFTSRNALLNAVVNATYEDGDGNSALGIDDEGTAFVADGSGGFTTATGGTAVSGFGSTIGDYVDLALDTGGAAWDLNQLRAGGLVADSFTEAFIDIKVQAITTTPTPNPEPATLTLLGAGLAGIGLAYRRRAARA
jgi:hypothetical protein